MKVEFEAIHVPSCGLDIHKDKIEGSVIDREGNIHQRTFNTIRMSLYAIKEWIMSLGCLHVLMESTSVFWIPIFEILEDITGMDVGVGNARHMKNIPGRAKTDKADANWIARLCMVGFIKKSFVVGRKFRELKEYTRYHKKLVQERVRQINRIEKLLQLNGFKLSSVLSDIAGLSSMRLLEKLCKKGSVTLEEVCSVLDRRVKKTAHEVEMAINGQMKLTSRILLSKMLKRLSRCDEELSEIYKIMVDISSEYKSAITLLDSIPGVGELSAMYILAEIGTDMSSFKTSGHIASWAGLAPKDNESAGKMKSSRTKKANVYVKSVLVECAWAAVKQRGTRLSNWYWSSVKRIGDKKAIIAVARKLLVYIYAMLKSGELYNDSLDVADMEKRKAQKLDSAQKTLEHHSHSSDTQQCGENIAQADDIGAAANLPLTNQASQEDILLTQSHTESGAQIKGNESTSPKKRGRPRKKADVSKENNLS